MFFGGFMKFCGITWRDMPRAAGGSTARPSLHSPRRPVLKTFPSGLSLKPFPQRDSTGSIRISRPQGLFLKPFLPKPSTMFKIDRFPATTGPMSPAFTMIPNPFTGIPDISRAIFTGTTMDSCIENPCLIRSGTTGTDTALRRAFPGPGVMA